jgi:hypothetical protein
VRSARLQKHLAYISIPKPIPPSGQFGIGENVDAPVPRIESQKQEFRIPQQSHLRFSMPICVLPLPIRTKRDRRSCFPRSLWGQALIIKRASQLHGKRSIRPDIGSHISRIRYSHGSTFAQALRAHSITRAGANPLGN